RPWRDGRDSSVARGSLGMTTRGLHAQLEALADAPAIVFSNSLGCDLTMRGEKAAAFRELWRVIRYNATPGTRSPSPAPPSARPPPQRDPPGPPSSAPRSPAPPPPSGPTPPPAPAPSATPTFATRSTASKPQHPSSAAPSISRRRRREPSGSAPPLLA